MARWRIAATRFGSGISCGLPKVKSQTSIAALVRIARRHIEVPTGKRGIGRVHALRHDDFDKDMAALMLRRLAVAVVAEGLSDQTRDYGRIGPR
jgi:hypothetical protein